MTESRFLATWPVDVLDLPDDAELTAGFWDSFLHPRDVIGRFRRRLAGEGGGGSAFRVLPRKKRGRSGDGYAAPGLWGRYGAAGLMIRNVSPDGTERFLLVQRGPEVSSNRGKWQLPGGALDEHETPEQGAAREIVEEVGASPGYLAGLRHVGTHAVEAPIPDSDERWRYSNIAVDSPEMFAPEVDGTETGDARWVTRNQLLAMAETHMLHRALARNLSRILRKYPDVNPVTGERIRDPSGRRSLTAAMTTAGKWRPEQHPRGADGKFIAAGPIKIFLSKKSPTLDDFIDAALALDVEKWQKLTSDQKQRFIQVSAPLKTHGLKPYGDKIKTLADAHPPTAPALVTPAKKTPGQFFTHIMSLKDHDFWDAVLAMSYDDWAGLDGLQKSNLQIKAYDYENDSDWESKAALQTLDSFYLQEHSSPAKKVAKKVAKKAAPPKSPAPPVADSAKLKKVGGQKGSNLGGFFEDPDTGERFYVKKAKTEQHAANEVAASALYALAGIETPAVVKTSGAPDIGGGLQTRTRLVPGAVSDLSTKLGDHAYRKKLREGFVVDAWLANWDVAGLGYDNVVTDKDGNPVRIDVGGALLYRAMGTPKGSAFGDVVGELETLRDPKMNPQSAKIFEGLTDVELRASAERVRDITPEQIDKIVAESGLPPSVAETLKKRRQHIIDKILTPTTLPALAAPPAKKYPNSVKLLDQVKQLTQAQWDGMSAHEKTTLTNAVENIGIHNSDLADQAETMLEKIADLDEGIHQPPTKPFWLTVPGVVVGKAELLAYGKQLTPDQWSDLTEDERKKLILKLDAHFPVIAGPDGGRGFEVDLILDKIQGFYDAEAEAAAEIDDPVKLPLPAVHTPGAPSSVIGHEGKIPGSPAKVTTKLIWGKHPDGTVILEVSGKPGISHQRVIWDDVTKKYVHQLDTATDPKYGEQWDTLHVYTKKDAYKTLQFGVWYVPSAATAAPETTPGHAPYVEGTVPDVDQVAVFYGKPGSKPIVVKLHSGQYVMTYGGDGASLAWVDEDPATLGWSPITIDPAMYEYITAPKTKPAAVTSPAAAPAFEPHDELDFTELFENMDAHGLAPGVIGVSSKGFWRMIVNDTGAIELQLREQGSDQWKLETFLNPETDNDLIDQLKTYTFESWLDPQSEAGKKALKGATTSASPGAAPTPSVVGVPIDADEIVSGKHKADDVLAVSSDGMYKLVWNGGPFTPLTVYKDNGSYWQEEAKLSDITLLKEGEKELQVALAGVSGDPSLTWIKLTAPSAPKTTLPDFWDGSGGTPIAGWSGEDMVSDWDFAFKPPPPSATPVVARSVSGNYRVVNVGSKNLIQIQRWDPDTGTWLPDAYVSQPGAAPKFGSMPEIWLVPHAGLKLSGKSTPVESAPPAPPGPPMPLAPPPPTAVPGGPTPPAHHVKVFKEIMKTQPGGAVGYWSKPEKLWQAITEMHATYKKPDGSPVYTYAAILGALDDATKTKEPTPHAAKLTKWLKTPAGAKVAKLVYGEAPTGTPVAPSTPVAAPSPPAPPVMKVPTPQEMFQKVWKQSGGSSGEVLLTGTDQLGNQIRIIATIATSGAHVALLQRFNPKTKKWARVKQYKTPNELSVALSQNAGFTWDAKPVEAASNISAVTDTSHIDQATKQALYDKFKKQPATYLSSPAQDIYAAASTIAADSGLSLGQMISIIDEMGALKVKKPDEKLFFKKMTEWLATPKGYAVAHGIQLPKPPTPTLVAGAGTKIPSLAESSKHAYPTITTHQANTLWDAAIAAHGTKWTSSQQAALRSYTGGVYYTLNSYLYGKIDSISAGQQTTMQQAQLGMRPSTQAMLLHRGVGYGGIGGAKSYEELLKLVGSTWKSEGFASTSVGGHAAFGSHPIIIEVEAPPGTPMAWVKPISQHPSENEMLLAAGLHFHVLKVTKVGNKSIVRVRVVPEP